MQRQWQQSVLAGLGADSDDEEEDADGAEVQVLDRVCFHVPSRTLELALPGGLPFRHVLLIDVQTFASIAEPLDLDAAV